MLVTEEQEYQLMIKAMNENKIVRYKDTFMKVMKTFLKLLKEKQQENGKSNLSK